MFIGFHIYIITVLWVGQLVDNAPSSLVIKNAHCMQNTCDELAIMGIKILKNAFRLLNDKFFCSHYVI